MAKSFKVLKIAKLFIERLENFCSMEKPPATNKLCKINFDEMDFDPVELAQDLVEDVVAGSLKVFDVRRTIMSIKHPGIRLKVDFHFRRLLRERMQVSGIDRLQAYANSLKVLKNRFNAEDPE
jgi:hypothetical protein